MCKVMESRSWLCSWGEHWTHGLPVAGALPLWGRVVLNTCLLQNRWRRWGSLWRLIFWLLWKDQLLGDSLSDFLNNLMLKGKNSVSDSHSSSSFARQPVQQLGCEVLQHHMLAATKTLREEMKFKIEPDENVDQVVPLCPQLPILCTVLERPKQVSCSCSQHTLHWLRNAAIFVILSSSQN